MATPSLPDDLRDALVVAVDDSPSGREALRFAASLASRLGERLHVVSVWNFVMSPGPDHDPAELPSLPAWQEAAEERLTALLAEELSGQPDLPVSPLVLHGNTTPTLLDVSKLAGQLVLGSRGRGGFAGMVLGSTSAALVQYGECAVTIVRKGSGAG